MQKWWLCICWCVPLLLSAQTNRTSTQDTLSVSFTDLPLEIILDSISYKSGYSFAYNAEALTDGSLYSFTSNAIRVDSLLNALLVGTGLTYTRLDDQIVIKKTPPEKSESLPGKLILTGYVREFETKRPIVGANIYINGTTIGTTTDQHGNYQIGNLPKGFRTVVFSHVGYELASYDLEVLEDQRYVVNAQLRQDIVELQGIEVTSSRLASDKKWSQNLSIFEKEFIGSSANAKSCLLLNPEVLDFYMDPNKDTLFARASEPLLIQNLALGYQISYELIYFKKTSNRTNFYGHARFNNLEPKSSKQLRTWRKNRKRTFRGSIFHFLQNLAADRHLQAGYQLYAASEINEQSPERIPSRSLLFKSAPESWQLSFDQYLIVVYENELESTQYLNDQLMQDQRSGKRVHTALSKLRPNAQKSVLELNSEFVTIDSYGQIKEPGGLTILGYWAWERVADMMPADYHPKTDKL
ncbi:carboxypeptidase-like regulatory domain-containing protein [Marinoscillum furvescens]|uniref:Carboxypeptidase-like protein n=1 Tax=Marinoscillum furvescens DSM 4134 TaxID=1122208 RepID=A0A3D9L0Z9_MARFU|nr:carboxypeptidase-like regulatory domain-containing protein [Marinoscillum furvescens]RED93890.1 carboxypeptidase-like protein [Marinoscillum furvescens DSM 4134]